MTVPNSIPRPLVRTNQWFIVISVIAAWVSSQPLVLLVPFLAGLLGLFLHFNPVMRVGKLFLKRPPSSYIPEDRDQQQFNQWIAVICLGISLIAFALKWSTVGYVFSAMVLLAAFVAILGFCIGCFIRFQFLMLQQRRKTRRS